MRLPHHLTQEPSGVFYFRLTVPKALRQALSKREIWHSLQTKDPAQAKRLAYAWSAYYLETWGNMKQPKLEDVLAAAQDARKYELTLPNGMKLKADGPEDHSRAIEAIGVMEKAGAFKTPAPAPTPPTSGGAGVKPLPLSGAITSYLTQIKAGTLPKTHKIKSLALQEFKAWKGNVILHTITRPDLHEYKLHLISQGIATPTITNKFSYLKGFFEAMRLAGFYPSGDNPAQGQATYTKKEKRRREKLGAEAFTLAEIKAIFAPKNFATLTRLHTRWACLIALHTGARLNEICQAAVEDFCVRDGFHCFNITDMGPEQKLKNEVSKRLIPLPQALIDAGLLEYIKRQKPGRIFPKLKTDGDNGPGDAVTKAFGRYLDKLGIEARTGRKSFHSFRDTMIQAMQDAKVLPVLQAAIVGHDLSDVHFTHYSKNQSLEDMKNAMDDSNGWGLELKPIDMQ